MRRFEAARCARARLPQLGHVELNRLVELRDRLLARVPLVPRERRRVERHLGRAVDRRLDLGDEVELGLRLIELPREDLALDLPLQHLLRPLLDALAL